MTPGSTSIRNPIFTGTHTTCNLLLDLDDDETLTTIMSCLTDISELEWTESQLRQKLPILEHHVEKFYMSRAYRALILKSDGSLEFDDDTWHAIMQTPRTEKSGLNWLTAQSSSLDHSQCSEASASKLNVIVVEDNLIRPISSHQTTSPQQLYRPCFQPWS